jgi:anti-sigma B factor antagonist
MEVSQASLSGIPLLRIVGDVDHGASSALEKAVQGALARDGGRILLDLSACPYIDSGGLSVIMNALREVRGRGWLGVIGASPNVIRVIEIVGLLDETGFRVFSSSQEAAAAIGG